MPSRPVIASRRGGSIEPSRSHPLVADEMRVPIRVADQPRWSSRRACIDQACTDLARIGPKSGQSEQAQRRHRTGKEHG